MGFTGNSSYATGNSYVLAMDDRKIRTLPWQFRVHVPLWREVR